MKKATEDSIGEQKANLDGVDVHNIRMAIRQDGPGKHPEQGGIISVMQEVFSKPLNEKRPLSEQEFYELRIHEPDGIWTQCFSVLQSRIQWSEIDRQFMCDEHELERMPTLEKAKERYESRRVALVERGFSESDMDF